MNRLALLLPLLLAACAETSGGAALRNPFAPAPEEPPAPEPLPAVVQAALPPGVPPSIVLQDANGCYLYSIERTEPPSGYPLLDGLGNPICEGGAAPVALVDAGDAPVGLAPPPPPPLAAGSIAPPAPIAPFNPA